MKHKRVHVRRGPEGRELIVDGTLASFYQPGSATTGSVWDATIFVRCLQKEINPKSNHVIGANLLAGNVWDLYSAHRQEQLAMCGTAGRPLGTAAGPSSSCRFFDAP